MLGGTQISRYVNMLFLIPMDRGAWGATVHGVAKSQTRPKRLSTHTGVSEPQQP